MHLPLSLTTGEELLTRFTLQMTGPWTEKSGKQWKPLAVIYDLARKAPHSRTHILPWMKDQEYRCDAEAGGKTSGECTKCV